MDIKRLDERLISTLESFEESLTVFDELQNDTEKISEVLKEKSKWLEGIETKYSKMFQTYNEELKNFSKQINEALTKADNDIEILSEEGDSLLSYIKTKNEKLEKKVEEALENLNNIFSEEISKYMQGLSNLDEKTTTDLKVLSSSLQELNKNLVENINAELSSVKVSIFNIIEDAKRASQKFKILNDENQKLKSDMTISNNRIEELKKLSNNQQLHIIHIENKIKESNKLQWGLFGLSIILIIVSKFV